MHQQKLPSHLIFKFLLKIILFELDNIATRCGWDQPHFVWRFYKPKHILRSTLPLNIKEIYILVSLYPIFDTYQQFYNMWIWWICAINDHLVKILENFGLLSTGKLFNDIIWLFNSNCTVLGRHIVIDSTYVQAWSERATKLILMTNLLKIVIMLV